MYLYLKKCTAPDTEVTVYLEQPSDIFREIQGIGEIRTEAEEKVYDVFFVLDCENSRLGFAEPLFFAAKKKINIDHHISNAAGCGDVNYVVPTASSASELVYQVMEILLLHCIL